MKRAKMEQDYNSDREMVHSGKQKLKRELKLAIELETKGKFSDIDSVS